LTSILPTDPHHAPDHLVAMVAALTSPPPVSPAGEPTAQQWLAQIRRVVDEVWATGWASGGSHVLARTPTPVVVELRDLGRTSPFTSPLVAATVATLAEHGWTSEPARDEYRQLAAELISNGLPLHQAATLLRRAIVAAQVDAAAAARRIPAHT